MRGGVTPLAVFLLNECGMKYDQVLKRAKEAIHDRLMGYGIDKKSQM